MLGAVKPARAHPAPAVALFDGTFEACAPKALPKNRTVLATTTPTRIRAAFFIKLSISFTSRGRRRLRKSSGLHHPNLDFSQETLT